MLSIDRSWNSIHVRPSDDNTLRELDFDAAAEASFMEQRIQLRAFILGLIRHQQDTEDLLQEVWLRYARAVTAGKCIQHPASWCRGVARNLVMHYWRSKRTARIIFDQDLMDRIEQAFEESISAQATAPLEADLLACLEQLQPNSRMLIEYKYGERLSAKTIAARMNKTCAAVHMAASRIRNWLRDCVFERRKRMERKVT